MRRVESSDMETSQDILAGGQYLVGWIYVNQLGFPSQPVPQHEFLRSTGRCRDRHKQTRCDCYRLDEVNGITGITLS